MKKSLITLTLAIAGIMNASAFRVGDYEYFENTTIRDVPENSVWITKYYGNETELTLPSYVDYEGVRHPVIAIYNNTFEKSPITSVVIPEPVVYIAQAAFKESRLEDISLPSTMRSMGNQAFLYVPVKHVKCPALLPPISPVYEDWVSTNTMTWETYSNVFDEWEWYYHHDNPNPPARPSSRIDATLEVPAATERLYRQRVIGNQGNVWYFFKTIKTLPETPAGVDEPGAEDAESETGNVYDITGSVVKRDAAPEDLLSLPKGIYIYKGKKLYI